MLRDRKASTSYIQRRLQIGYNRAATLMERMEQEGVVGARPITPENVKSWSAPTRTPTRAAPLWHRAGDKFQRLANTISDCTGASASRAAGPAVARP